MEPLVIAVSVNDVPPPARILDRVGHVVWQNVPPGAYHATGGAMRVPGTSPDGSRCILELLNLPGRDLLAETRSREAEHRSRNLVSLALAIARQSLRTQQDQPDVAEYLERLRSLESVVRIGCEVEGDFCSVPLIVRRVTERFELRGMPQIDRLGPDMLIASRWAHVIALVLHELGVNAIRHGALSAPKGRVELRWTVLWPFDGHERFTLSWRESGGPPVDASSQAGSGMRILRELTAGSSRSDAITEATPEGISYQLTLLLLRRELVRK